MRSWERAILLHSTFILASGLLSQAVNAEQFDGEPVSFVSQENEATYQPLEIQGAVESVSLKEVAMINRMAKAAGCESCQASAEKKAAQKKAVASAYSTMFFNNNFDYLCDPSYDDYHLGEDLKRMCLGSCSVLDIGGQYRARYHHEQNFRGFGLTGNDDDFLLHRTRLYTIAA